MLLPELSTNYERTEAELLTELDALFINYDRCKESVSLEGLVNVASRILIALSDYLRKVLSNIGTNLTSFLKNVRRSELEGYISSNKTATKLTYRVDYSKIRTVMCPTIPFTLAPEDLTRYMNKVMVDFNMLSRSKEMLTNYTSFNKCIKSDDMEHAVTILDTLDNNNMVDIVSEVSHKIQDIVIVKLPNKLTRFGTMFNSNVALKTSVDTCLKSSGEFNDAISSEKVLRKLYKVLDNTYKILSNVDISKVDISKLKKVATVVRDTGDLINTYGMSIKELHHTEHWLVGVLGSVKSAALIKK